MWLFAGAVNLICQVFEASLEGFDIDFDLGQ
jgi:hypothetical protein